MEQSWEAFKHFYVLNLANTGSLRFPIRFYSWPVMTRAVLTLQNEIWHTNCRVNEITWNPHPGCLVWNWSFYCPFAQGLSTTTLRILSSFEINESQLMSCLCFLLFLERIGKSLWKLSSVVGMEGTPIFHAENDSLHSLYISKSQTKSWRISWRVLTKIQGLDEKSWGKAE